MTTTGWNRVRACIQGEPKRFQSTARWLAMAVALSLSGLAHADTHCQVGEPLADVLRSLQRAGVPVSFSSTLVRPTMKVGVVPRAVEPRAVLAELLTPHGLTLREGPGGALLVVRAAAAKVRMETAGTHSSGTHSSPPIEPVVPQEPRGPLTVAVAGGGMVTAVSDAIEVTSTLEQGPVRPLAVRVEAAQLAGQPSARDPWSLLQLAPGVIADRVNVGGSESGRQMRFAGPGTTSHENSFSIDGVNATDMAAVGTSAVYYDFDQLEEVRIGTGGADVRMAVAGVSIELITKRGADVARGSARLLVSGDAGSLASVAGRQSSATGGRPPGNRVHRVAEGGAELGGAVVAGRLWGWVAASQTSIGAQAVDGAADDTRLDHGAIKLNTQLGPAFSGVVSILDSNKRKPSRAAGPERAFEATWRQRGPTQIGKVEGTRLFGGDTTFTGQLSLVDGGFRLSANGGEGALGGEALLDADGVWKNGMLSGPTDRDSQRVQLEGSHYQAGRGLGHEWRFGGSYRRYALADSYIWPGSRQAYNIACENIGTCGAFGTGDLIIFQRVGSPASDLDFGAAWLQDRIRTRRLTFDLGLRFDRQDGRNRPGAAAANAAVPDLLPALTSPATAGGFRWQTVSPRLGLVASLGDGRTRFRSSLGRFAEQLSTEDVARLNPVAAAEANFFFDDRNGDNIWQEEEPITFLTTTGVNRSVPGAPSSPNRTDPGLRPETTDELVVGIERTFSANVVVALDLTVRRIGDILEERLLVTDATGRQRLARASDYQLDEVVTVVRPDGETRQVPFYALERGLTPSGGTLLINGDRERHYAGVTLSVMRRHTGRWSFRGHLNYGQAVWRVPASFRAFDDPTDMVGGGDNDGGLHAERIPGRDIAFLHSTWSGSFQGQVRIAPLRPWGFNVAANVLAREGFPLPYFLATRSGADGLLREAQLTAAVDEFRAESVVSVDLRLEKTVSLWQQAAARGLRATFAVEIFNLFNEQPILRREVNLAMARGNDAAASLAPRVARFGVRLQWH